MAASIISCDPLSIRQYRFVWTPLMSALQETPFSPRYLSRCMARARLTRLRMSPDASPDRLDLISLIGTGGRVMCISIRSSKGPDILLRYLRTCKGVQTQPLSGFMKYPHGQGFMAQTSMNRVG